MASQEPPASPSKPILESPTESWIIRFYETGSNVVDFRGRTFSNIIHRNDEYLHHNDDYLHLLFPTPESPPVVDREIVLAFRTRQALKDQLRKAYLRILRLYGFKCVVSKQTGKLWLQNLEGWSIEGAPAGDYLSHSSKHHSRFNRILFSLRLLGFEQEALIFHEKLCELIGKKVQPAYRLAWERSMKADLTPMLSLGSPENDKEQGPPVDGALQDKPPKPNAPASKQDTKARKPSKDKYAAQQPEDRASALASWKTEALPPQVKVRPVFGPSIIPSPLAPGGVDAHDWSTLPETLRRRFSNRVATLWYSAFEQHSAGANDAEIQEKIAELDKEDGQNLVCYLESIPATDATSTATSTTTTTAIAAAAHFESIPLRKVILPPALFPANDIFTLVGRAAILGKKLKITFCALENRAHGSIDTFIYNPWHASFRVNGVPLPPSLLAGPLSPFSIIEAESAVVFWFRDRDACNYVPGLLSKPRRKRSHDEIGDGDTAETPENIPPLSPRKRQKLNDELKSLTRTFIADPPANSWAGILHSGLLRARATQKERPNAISLNRSDRLMDEDVVNGIAAFWTPLARSGRVFGFGVADLFGLCRTKEGQEALQMTACGVGSETFIMPLYFNSMDGGTMMANVAAAEGKKAEAKAKKAAEEEKAKAKTETTEGEKEKEREGGGRYNLRPRSKSKSPNDSDGSKKGTQKGTPPADPTKNAETKGKGKGKEAEKAGNSPPARGKMKPLKSPSPDRQAQQGIPMGHLLLAVATRVSPPSSSTTTTTNPTEPTTDKSATTSNPTRRTSKSTSKPTTDPATTSFPHIHLTIFDSCPSFVAPPLIHATARNLVLHTGWLGLLPSTGQPDRSIVPTFTTIPSSSSPSTTEYKKVPRQVGADTCGLYTILNAWACMLGLRVYESSARRRKSGCGADEVFESLAREIVDLAMGGWVSEEVVGAFLRGFGYVEEWEGGEGARREEGGGKRGRKGEERKGRKGEERKGRKGGWGCRA